jgi:hypothetical protein
MQGNGKRIVAVVVLGPNRTAMLRVSGLAAAPSGKTYEAWVISSGRRAEPAGLFRGGAGISTVRLHAAVPQHAVVAVTIERAGGVSSPTTSPVLTAQT